MHIETLNFQAMGTKGTYMAGYVEGVFKECKRLGVKLNFEYTIDAIVKHGLLGSRVIGYKIDVKLSGKDKAMVTRIANVLAKPATA